MSTFVKFRLDETTWRFCIPAIAKVQLPLKLGEAYVQSRFLPRRYGTDERSSTREAVVGSNCLKQDTTKEGNHIKNSAQPKVSIGPPTYSFLNTNRSACTDLDAPTRAGYLCNLSLQKTNNNNFADVADFKMALNSSRRLANQLTS